MESLDTPGLLIAGTRDDACPIEATRRMVEEHSQQAGRSRLTLREFPLTHFEFLDPKHFQPLVQTVAEYFKANL